MLSRIGIVIVVFLIVACTMAPSQALDVTLTGSWTTTIDANSLSAGPGSNLLPTYESDPDQVSIDISNSLGGGDSWRVDVSKSDINWSASINISVKRASDGTGGSISGGTSYLQISNVDQSFFSGAGDILGIDVQYRLGNISVSISPDTYSTTIIYTVVDL